MTLDLITDVIADTEFGHMTRQCLGMNIGDTIRLKRNKNKIVDTSFTALNISQVNSLHIIYLSLII